MSKKIVVVTALIGAYDNSLLEFDYNRDEYEFICYTNMKRLKSDTWNIVYVDNLEVPNNNAKSSYYYKWNPHKYLDSDKYDTMIWVDSSFVDIDMDELGLFVDRFKKSGKPIFIEKHPSRSSLLEELEANIHFQKDDTYIMRQQVEGYFDNGYDEKHTVMVETGLSIRDYKNKDLIKFSEAIWAEMYPKGNTKRDQLVYDYCMWKSGFTNKQELFTFGEKLKVIKFADHPHRPNHKEQVLLVGPWLGEEQFEEGWIQHVEQYVSKHAVDTVIVGCRPNREFMYKSISPDRFIISDPEGTKSGNLLDNRVPQFNITSNNSEKEIIKLSTDCGYSGEDKDIHILWATIRPEVFNEVYTEWINKADSKDNIIPHILVESEEDKNKITAVPKNRVIVEKSKVKGVAYPSYVLSSRLNGYGLSDKDIVIFASDDFHPMDSWDTALYKEYVNFDGGLQVNDKNGAQAKDIVTIPIMAYSTLKKLNHIIYHPVYNHCWSDNELHLNLKEMGLLRDISVTKPEIYFNHKHFVNMGREKDKSDEHNMLTNFTGNNIWKIRQTISLEERLKVELLKKTLSILVLTIPGREHLLERLKSIIEPQLTEDVELLIEFDDGSLEVGAKRNKVLDRSNGRYICFVDDDDRVSDTYISDIMAILNSSDVDCCSLVGEITIDNGTPQKFIHSLKYKTWFEEGEGADKVYYRNPNHLNVIKRAIAKHIRFKDSMSYGEDADFSARVRPFLSVQGEIAKPLYFYDAVSNK